MKRTREYTVVPIVLDEDEPQHTAENGYRCANATCPCQPHTDERPFCSALEHECHHSHERFWKYCQRPYDDGLITKVEQARIFYDEQVVPR